MVDRSVAMGLLYEQSRVTLVVFAVLAQLISLPLFVIAKRHEPSPRQGGQVFA